MSLTTKNYINYTSHCCKPIQICKSVVSNENVEMEETLQNRQKITNSSEIEDDFSVEGTDSHIIKYPPFWFGEESNGTYILCRFIN